MSFRLIDRRLFAERTAALMFWLAFLFLIGQAVLVTLWVDVPDLRESAKARLEQTNTPTDANVDPVSPAAPEAAAAAAGGLSASSVELGAAYLLIGLWPLFLAESILHWLTRPWNARMRWFHFTSAVFCLCPSLRMCARMPEMGGRMWLPTLGWRRPDRRLRRHLERRFSFPMILIALLIMPVLIVEFFLKHHVAEYAWLRLMLHIGTGVIWFAFAAEFILMISVAEKKVRYLKEHWIDLAIILLPLLSFLRSLQMFRASRLFRLARLPQMTRLVRVYRLRGTAIRAFRALLVLNVLQRLFRRDRETTIQDLEGRLWELRRETRLIERQLFRLRSDDGAPPNEAALDRVSQRKDESVPSNSESTPRNRQIDRRDVPLGERL